MRLAILLATVSIAVGSAAERHWQIGKWTAVSVQRQMIDFGPGASSFDRGRPNPPTNAMADVHLYTIETDTDHLEVKDVVRVRQALGGRRGRRTGHLRGREEHRLHPRRPRHRAQAADCEEGGEAAIVTRLSRVAAREGACCRVRSALEARAGSAMPRAR